MGDIFGALEKLEISERPCAASMNYSLGNTLVVEALNLGISDKVFYRPILLNRLMGHIPFPSQLDPLTEMVQYSRHPRRGANDLYH